MRRLIALIALLASHAVPTPALSADVPADRLIRQELIGSWIVPTNSTDYGTWNEFSLETFRPDGTYTVYFFTDKTCTKVNQAIDVRWSVENGTLITYLPNGGTTVDDVIAITDRGMTLRSHEDGTTYTRVKAASCAAPLS